MNVPRHATGFTLVELIIASVLTVLIAGAATAMLTGITSVRSRVDERSALHAEAQAAIEAIVSALRNTHRPPGNAAATLEGADDVLEDGAPADRLRLQCVSHQQVRPGQPESDVQVIEFRLHVPELDDPVELFDTAPALVRRRDPTVNLEPDEGGVLEVVARNVVALELLYFDGEEWQEEWRDQPTWPEAVHVRLIVAKPDRYGKLRVVQADRIVDLPGARASEASTDGQANTGGRASNSEERTQ